MFAGSNTMRKNFRAARHVAGGIALGATIGSLAGTAFAGQTENDQKLGATIGGVAGATIGGLIPLAAHNPEKTLQIIGTPAYGIGSGIIKSFENGTAMNFFESVGMGAVSTASMVGKGAGVIGANTALALGKSGTRMVGATSRLLKSAEDTVLGYKLNLGGKIFATAGVIAKGIVGGFSTFNKIHQGTIEPGLTRATPQPVYSSMMDNAGATGDLVFALHNNRRG